MKRAHQSVPALALKKICKTYGNTSVLEDVSFEIDAGSVVSIVGENGAGKSTLAKILAGITPKDSGDMRIFGERVEFINPAEAIRRGIGLVHQELAVLENLSVAENILLGHESTKRGFLDKRRNIKRAQSVLDRLASPLSPSALVKDLSIAQKQQVEIARALSFDAKIIIFDEPTSSLSEHETSHLLETIRHLKSSGVTILYVSHRLAEVQAISDKVIVLRDGAITCELAPPHLSKETITTHMIGRPISDMYRYRPRPLGKTIFSINDWTPTPKHAPLSFHLRRGEILGIAGLVGSGRSELLRSLFGLEGSNFENVRLDNQPYSPRSPDEAIRHGVYLVPEDRKSEGILPGFSIRDTISLACKRYVSGLFRSFAQERAEAKDVIKRFGVRCTGEDQTTDSLSGGNQQKVLIGKALSTRPILLLLDEPTRGVDIGAKQAIYEQLFQLSESGLSVLFVSSELEEVMGIADRALVMHEGAIAGIVDRDQFSEERLFQLAAHNQLSPKSESNDFSTPLATGSMA